MFCEVHEKRKGEWRLFRTVIDLFSTESHLSRGVLRLKWLCSSPEHSRCSFFVVVVHGLLIDCDFQTLNFSSFGWAEKWRVSLGSRLRNSRSRFCSMSMFRSTWGPPLAQLPSWGFFGHSICWRVQRGRKTGRDSNIWFSPDQFSLHPCGGSDVRLLYEI